MCAYCMPIKRLYTAKLLSHKRLTLQNCIFTYKFKQSSFFFLVKYTFLASLQLFCHHPTVNYFHLTLFTFFLS